MIERNELRIRHVLSQLDMKLKQQAQQEMYMKELELKAKLAEIYKDDKEGFNKAVNEMLQKPMSKL